MQRLPHQSARSDYFLQVVKREEIPEWPRPTKELLVGSQMLSSGFVQYWAYPKDSGKYSDELPQAEVVASENLAPKPVILVNQLKDKGLDNDLIELVLTKDGHAWAKTETNLENLEDNLNSLVEFAKDKYGISVEHFLTIPGVSEEVEKSLDEIEGGGRIFDKGERSSVSEQSDLAALSQRETEDDHHLAVPKDIGAYYVPGKSTQQKSGNLSSSTVSKLVFMPVLILLLAIVGFFLFKNRLVSKAETLKQLVLSSVFPIPTSSPTPTVMPVPTSTPTPTVDRSKYKIRVLNGTLQSGAASVLADTLKSSGWQIIKVGNADDNNTPSTVIKIKKGEEAVGSLLVLDLAPKLSASTSADLSASDKADAEIIIGKK